jgi:outer membrane protein insertion porin family
LKNVLSVVKLKKGKSYSSEEARENVRFIAGLEYFDNVEVRFDDHSGVLTFDVTEKPYVERLIFKGNAAISTGKLKNTSVLKEKEYYDLIKLEETKSKIVALYKDRGYADCIIEVYPTVDADTNKMTITFLITENNKISIGGVKIEGVISYKDKKILKLMKTKPKKIFKENIFNADKAAIQTFYQDNGFMDYQFVSSANTYNEARTEMFLTLNISEGGKYEIGSITYDGNFAVEDKEIKKIIKFKKGQVFNQHKVDETIQNIYLVYSDKGYLHAVVNRDFNKQGTGGIVDVNLSIQENSIVYVGNVYIDGLVSTKDKVIRREVLVKPGDVFSIKRVRRSIERIHNLGFIESVEPQMMPTGALDILDLSLAVVEGKAGSIMGGVGYSNVDQLIGTLELNHMNLFGLGQRLRLMSEFGAKRQNYQVSWTEPRIFDKEASLTLSVFDMKRKKDFRKVTEAYEEHRLGFNVMTGPRLSENVWLSFGYGFEKVDLSDIDKEVKFEIEHSSELQKDKITSISAQCVYDSRDYAFDPSRGNMQLVNLQLASDWLGGDINYVKGLARSTWFFPTFWKFVLSVNMEAGAITAYGNQSKVPIYARFKIGGADSIRGYKYGTEIGPDIGGVIKSIMNVEYKFPIVSEKGRPILQGAVFYDIGGTWRDFEHINLNLGSERENLHSGVGFGIRFATPVLPIRLDWGYGLNHKEGEPLQQFYFTIGNAI